MTVALFFWESAEIIHSTKQYLDKIAFVDSKKQTAEKLPDHAWWRVFTPLPPKQTEPASFGSAKQALMGNGKWFLQYLYLCPSSGFRSCCIVDVNVRVCLADLAAC